MYKYSGLFTAQERNGRLPGHMGCLYFGHVLMRPFNPLASLELFCPLRRKAWALSTPAFDYRVAQNSGALEPRDGRWYSRALEQLEGELDRVWPKLDTVPDEIDCVARVSWWPPHATVIWQSGGFYQKLSFRPVTDAPCDWTEIRYDEEWVTADMRERFPEVFAPEKVRVAEVVPPRPSTVNPPPADTPPVPVVTENNPPTGREGTGAPETSNDNPRDWNNITDSNDLDTDWEYNDWNNQSNTWWAPAYNWTPDETTPTERHDEKQPESPPQISTPPAEVEVVQHCESPTNETTGIASITVQETMHTVRTRSIQPTIQGTGHDNMEAMLALQSLAMTGAPCDRQDRLNRQHLASSLHLPPEIYNYLVFGERETDTAAIADQSAIQDPPPPSP